MNKYILLISLILLVGCGGRQDFLGLEKMGIELPVSDVGNQLSKLDGMTLHIKSDGKVFLKGDEINIDELCKQLNDEYEQVKNSYEAKKKAYTEKWPELSSIISKSKIIPILLVVDKECKASSFQKILKGLVWEHFANIHLITTRNGKVTSLSICLPYYISFISPSEPHFFWRNEFKRLSWKEHIKLCQIKILGNNQYQVSPIEEYYPRIEEFSLSEVDGRHWVSYSYSKLAEELLERESKKNPLVLRFSIEDEVNYQHFITALTLTYKLPIAAFEIRSQKYRGEN